MFGRRVRNGRGYNSWHRFGVTAITLAFGAGTIALGFAPANSVAASAATTAAPVVVGSDAHHDTSRPLHSYQPTSTKATMHPVKHAAPGPQGPPAADTSGVLAPTANAPATINNFDGTPDNSGVIPSDDTGAAGTTQYFEIVNSQIAVYNKSGGRLLGPENTNTLWSGFGGSCQTNNDGDGTVQFDTLSQRWVVEQLEVSTQPFYVCVAVSTSADATGSWNRYSFQYTNFPDYPKLGIWPDAYYLTVNQFNAAGTVGLGEMTCALNRASMLAGTGASEQCYSLNSSGENTVLPATLNGTTPPAAGAPEWLVGISPTSTPTASALAYWQLHIDWTTPSNSSLSAQTNLPVTSFSEACGGAGTCIPQSGTSQKLDSLGDRLMYDLPYRNFGDHESIMVTHSIVAGSTVGMRWYELRPSGSTLVVAQTGTHAPDNTTYRWMGSIGMDKSGDVALGYSTSSSTLHPGVAYTGRLASDPVNTMPQGETTLFTGGGSQIASLGNPGNRWGDYSGMSIDPGDDCTFWYVNQYVPSNGDFNWHTRIGSFKFPSCGGTAGNDFSISANPTSLTLQQSTSGSSTISTAVTSGVAGTVSFAVSGIPSGASAPNPAGVTAGGSTTLTVNAGTATPGSYTLTVTGSETTSTGTATHSTTVALTVTGGGGSVVANGGFETGNLGSWTTGGVYSPTVATTPAHSGSHSALLGANTAPEPNGDSSLTQTISVPTGGSTLSFWYWPSTTDTITYDWQEAQIRDTSGNTLASVFKVCSNAQAWTQVSFDMTPYAGQNVELYFNAHGDGYGDLTYMYLDDVSVTPNGPPPSDFSISASAFSPASVSQGGSATNTITTAVTSGSAQTITLSASGVPAGATPTFTPSTVTAGGSATLTVATSSSTPPGTYSITVTGTGTSNTHSASPVSLAVAGNDFSISASPTALSLDEGAQGTSTISTAVTSGNAGTVNLSVSGTPSGATATLNPPSTITAGQSDTLTVNAGTATPGSYTLTVTGTEGAATHSTTVSLAVNDFTISANPTSLTLPPSTAGSSTISTTVAAGAAATVTLSVSGTPAGATATLASTSVTAGAGTTLNVNSGTAAPGGYTLTVTGTEGGESHSATVALTVTTAGPPPGLQQVSSDTFTDPAAEHATEVEPDTLSNGTTMVSVFQVGRFNNGGADAIGFATTTNGGASWTQGLIPGLTTAQGGTNLGWARVSDPAVAYNPKTSMWIVEALTLDTSVAGRGVAVAVSPDGVTWSAPSNAISQTADSFDKSWIVCDTTSTSSHYGNCYIEFDDNSLSNTLRMITSTDGGTTWSVARGTSDTAHGLGGQPLVQPNGTVIVPYFADSASQIRAFVSTNGGSSWNSSRLISSVTDHAAAGGLRTEPLPSAEIDSSGRVYVVWQDCRFRSGCTSNDIVMSKSTNGTSWNSVTRVPIDATTSGADHFIPGLAVDRSTSGSTAHLGLYYYYYPVASCTSCSLDVGFISSTNGGTSWGSATQVAGPMTLNELAPTTQGPMVGDYMSASFIAGKAWAVFAVGVPGSGSTLNEAMYTFSGGLAAPGGTHQPDSGGGQGHARGHSSTAF